MFTECPHNGMGFDVVHEIFAAGNRAGSCGGLSSCRVSRLRGQGGLLVQRTGWIYPHRRLVEQVEAQKRAVAAETGRHGLDDLHSARLRDAKTATVGSSPAGFRCIDATVSDRVHMTPRSEQLSGIRR